MAPTFAALRPSYGTPTSIASYTNGAYSMTGSGTDGSTTFTRSGGHPSADAGTGTWQAVVEYDDGSLEFNVVVSASTDTFTLAHALNGTAVGLHCAHSGASGQHLSPKGSAALAQYAFNLTRAASARYNSIFSMWHDDIYDYNSTVPTIRNPDVWQSYGGLPTTNHPFRGTANIYSASGYIYADGTICVQALTDAVGEGLKLTINTHGKRSRLQFPVGFTDNTLTAQGAIDVLVDGVSFYTATFGTFITWHSIDIAAGTEDVEIRITRTTAGTTGYTFRVGQVDLIDLTDVTDPDATFYTVSDDILMIGDSWLDDGHASGAAFTDEMEALVTGGSVVNEAIQGSQISDWIASLPGWLTTHAPTKVLLHTGINEETAGVTATTFWQDVARVFEACRAKGVPCLYLMQGTTASQAQAQRLAIYMAMQTVSDYGDRFPKLPNEWLNSVTQKELDLATAVVNIRSKDLPGRTVLRVTDGVTVAPDGPDADDTWSAV